MRHKVEISGVNTADIKTLSNEEMTNLFIRLQGGEEEAREILANGNLKLVLSVLKRFQYRNDNPDDLFQVGCIGLLKSIDNFDLKHNVKFSTYAVPMIIGEIRRYLRDNNAMRISRSLKDIAYKALKTKEELMIKNDKEPTLKEIASILEVSEFTIKNAIESLQEPVSLFEPIYNDGGDTIYVIDQVDDKKIKTANWDLSLSIEKGLNSLEPRERHILEERFFVGKTQMEVADEIGISQAQISRLEKKALKTIGSKLK